MSQESGRVVSTQLCERFRQSAGTLDAVDAGPIRSDALIEELRILGPPYLESVRAAVLRRLAVADARRNGVSLSEDDLCEAIETFRRKHDCLSRVTWMLGSWRTTSTLRSSSG
jgi:hypothetical protein